MKNIFNIKKILLVTFSYGLAIGQYNIFSKTAELKDNILPLVVAITILVYAIIKGDILTIFKKSKKNLFLLSFTLLGFAISSFINTLTRNMDLLNFNYKLLGMIILFILLTYYFSKDYKLAILSLIIYILTNGLIASLVLFNLIPDLIVYSNGRLILFGENSNSTSTRMLLSFLSILYIIIENPIKFGKIRYLLLLLIPGIINFIIETGSRGSIFILAISIIVILFFVKMRMKYKITTSILLLITLFLMFKEIIINETVYQRVYNSIVYGDTANRSKIWDEALQIFYNDPIIGVSEKGYTFEMTKSYGENLDTHNIILYLLVSGGIVSTIPFLIFIMSLLRKSYKIFSISSFPLILLISLLLITMKTGGVLTYSVMWYYFAVILSSYYVISRNNAKESF